MNPKKVLGIFLLLLGLVLVIFQITLTGNVISDNESNLKSIFGFVFILAGVVLLAQKSLVDKIETEDNRIGNVVKFKPCKRVNLSRVKEEIKKVKRISRNPNSPEGKTYHLHQVPVANKTYLVADAKILNRATNQSKRGNLRYLFDRETNDYMGLAKERDNGSYDQVA